MEAQVFEEEEERVEYNGDICGSAVLTIIVCFKTLHNESNRCAKSKTSGLRFTAYITHNATMPLSDIVGGDLSDYMQLPLETLKAFTTGIVSRYL